MIAATLKVDNGVENLWKRGQSEGLEPHANFGQYIPLNYFKCFKAGLPFLWCDEKFWYRDPRSLPWDVVLPFLKESNEKRNALLRVWYLILDESMSGWRPKTSKTGGLQNISHEPRKPVDLGTMIKNGAECITGIMAFNDIVQGPVQQREKKYLSEETKTKTHMPNGEDMYCHIAECLRQAEGAQLREGGWMGGDAWFGSVPCAIELMKILGIYSTFIVKQNVRAVYLLRHRQELTLLVFAFLFYFEQTAYFPMEALHAVLRARYPDNAAGHWVVMKAVIAEVDVFVMAYAWSNKGVSYIVSTCGTTVQHMEPYVSKFEDVFGNVNTKELARPTIAHILYEFLPSIDEHNKARQASLALEKCWPTKAAYFRVMTTLIGMAVVDLMASYTSFQ